MTGGCISYNNFFTHLANKSNLQIINLLQSGSKNVKMLTSLTEKEQSAVSHNLHNMLQCNIVKMEKKGRERVYSLNTEFIGPIFELVDKHADANCGVCKHKQEALDEKEAHIESDIVLKAEQ